MRKSLIFNLLTLLVASALPAQFITDVRPDGRQTGRVPRFSAISIENHTVDVRITDGVARTTVHQIFRNPNQMNLEGTYMFPLPEGAAVAGFSMRMGGKMVKGEILEKDQAASIYEGIVRRQQDPALLEFMGKRLFRARVFPIPPRGVAEIKLSYDETLSRDGRTVELRYPYRTRSVSHTAVGRTSVTVSISSSEKVLTVYSPSHEVDVVKNGDHEAKVSYEARQDPGDRDFVVVYGLAKGSVGATLFTHSEDGDEGAFMLLLAPSSEERRIVAKDVIFVVDTSGSMAGEKMAQTKKALAFCIKSLGDRDRFNIVPFATEAVNWKGDLQAVSAQNRDEALAYVNQIQARGGTNINDALVSALGMSHDQDRPLMVIFMTDGAPTIGVRDTAGIVKNVTNANKALTRLFVFGVGENVKVDLLDLLAEKNHGARDYVGSKEDIEVKVSSFFQKVSSPVLTDVAVTIDGIRTSDVYPKQLSDFFHGAQLMLTGRYQGTGTATVRLTGKVDGKKIEHVFERALKPGGDKTAFVPRLWAVRKVGYLMDQIRLSGRNDELRKEIVRLGKRYGIVTPYTSYLVIEDDVAAVPGSQGSGRPLPRNGRGGGGSGNIARPPRPGADGAAARVQDESAAEKEARRVLDKLAEAGQARVLRGLESQSGRTVVGTPLGGTRLEGADREAQEAVLRFKRNYYAGGITLSKELKRLREKRVAGNGGLVRRVGNRTFLMRPGLMVETDILDLDATAITKKLVRIEAFSADYFELLRKKGLAKVLALGHSLLFIHGDRVIQIVPAGTLVKQAEKTEK